MKISLFDVGKRFNREWIFSHLSFDFHPSRRYSITGPNGSGKSTLLQMISGAVAHSTGKINYRVPNVKGDQLAEIPNDRVYQYVSIAAPYLELIEEMTAVEMLSFHQKFKRWLPSIDSSTILHHVGLQSAGKKQIRFFSSGMKQRLKLAQAIFSDVPCVLLDEPCTNLDEEGIALYLSLIEQYCRNRMIIIASNDRVEYQFCEENLDITKWKNNSLR